MDGAAVSRGEFGRGGQGLIAQPRRRHGPLPQAPPTPVHRAPLGVRNRDDLDFVSDAAVDDAVGEGCHHEAPRAEMKEGQRSGASCSKATPASTSARNRSPATVLRLR